MEDELEIESEKAVAYLVIGGLLAAHEGRSPLDDLALEEGGEVFGDLGLLLADVERNLLDASLPVRDRQEDRVVDVLHLCRVREQLIWQ